MPGAPWDERFFAATRGQIVLLLRRGPLSVDQIAQAVGLTPNGVRAHLATLERDRLVEQRGVRRGRRKPTYLYALTPTAEELFPKAYAPVLRHLLSVLHERLPGEQLHALLQAVGRQMAVEHSMLGEELDGRARRALALWEELGGSADLDASDGTLLIRGYSCPLAAVVPAHPQLCEMAETLLSELIGVPVRERCDRSAPPRCSFEVAQPSGRSGPGVWG
jgi:predicted ArsR family transcriptional regulator